MLNNPKVYSGHWRPISTMMLYGLILLYTLPAAPIVIFVVALVCLATWWAVRLTQTPTSEKDRLSGFNNIISLSAWLLIILSVIYDAALIAGPKNSFVANIENKSSIIPLIHFAERYRAGAAMVGEPLPNISGVCLTLIAFVSFAAGASFNALGAKPQLFGPGKTKYKKGGHSAIVRPIVVITTIFVIANALLALSEFASSLSTKSYLFKMRFITGPFVWSIFLFVMLAVGSLMVKDFELIYYLNKKGDEV